MNLRSRFFLWPLFWFSALSLMLWWFWSDEHRSASRYLESAELKWEAEDYLGAIQEYERIIEEYPRSPRVSEARYWQGVAYFLYLDKPRKAITSFEESILSGHSSANIDQSLKAYLYIAKIYAKKLNQAKKAIAVYEKVMEISPDPDQVLEVLFKVGDLYFELGDLDQARVEWDMLAKKDPNNEWAPLARYREAGTYFIVGRCEEAIEIYQTLYTEYPEHEMSPFAKFRSANCLEEIKSPAEALQLYRELEGIYPDRELLAMKIKMLEEGVQGL